MARSKRNDFLAGLFILASAALLAGILIGIHDWTAKPGGLATWYVEFQQAAGVKVNSPVLLRGGPVGRVTSVEMTCKAGTTCREAEDFVYLVGLELPDKIRLRRNAVIVIEGKLIGDGASIDVLSIGNSSEPVASKSRDEPIPGQSSDMMAGAAAALGIGDKEREEISISISNIKALTADLRQAGPKITSAMTNVDNITSGLAAKMPQIAATVDKLKSASEQFDGILTENREKLKTSIANIESMTGSAKTDVGAILGAFAATSNDIRAVVSANRMNLTDMLANLRVTSEQLKAASLDIRRAPWRLLYKPEEREANSLNIYDASRSYAEAAADLHSATMTLESVAALHKEGVPVDDKVLHEMLDRVKTSLDRYGEAESALWKQWDAAGKKK